MNDLWHLNVNQLTDNVHVIGCFKGFVLENSTDSIIWCRLNDNGSLRSFQLNCHMSVILNVSDFCDIHMRQHSVNREWVNCLKDIRWGKNTIVNPISDYNRLNWQVSDTKPASFFSVWLLVLEPVSFITKINLQRFSHSARNLGCLTAILLPFGRMEK